MANEQGNAAVKAWLLRGLHAHRRVKALEQHLAEQKTRLKLLKGANPTGMPRTGRWRDWTLAVDAVVDEESETAREIQALYAIQREVREAIAGVEPDTCREVLEYRYLYYMAWPKIAAMMDYDERYLHKLHNQGLEKLRIIRGAEKNSETGH